MKHEPANNSFLYFGERNQLTSFKEFYMFTNIPDEKKEEGRGHIILLKD